MHVVQPRCACSNGGLVADGPDLPWSARRPATTSAARPAAPRCCCPWLRVDRRVIGRVGQRRLRSRSGCLPRSPLVVGVLSVDVPASALAVAPAAGRICIGADCGIAGVTLASSKFTVTRGLMSVRPGPMTVTIELTAQKAPVLSARGRLVFSRSTVGTGQCAQKVTTAKAAHYDGPTHTLVQ